MFHENKEKILKLKLVAVVLTVLLAVFAAPVQEVSPSADAAIPGSTSGDDIWG